MERVDLDRLRRTSDEMVGFDRLKEKLEAGKRLRIKYGVDVTAAFLHIGHAVNLWMMRALQERGHIVVFLVGDFTTRIGDPTGRSAARVVPSREDINRNAEAFIEQVGQVLLTDPEVFEVRRNSEWFDTMAVDEFLGLLAMVTHARLIRRDMFQRRIAGEQEIHMHELLYPILQGYDSKMLESDLTIVGSDQKFNELMGRTYQEKFGQDPQAVITTKITAGIDGKAKQSKTLGNYIALADSPRDKFGKAMSIPDDLIVPYLEVYTEVPMEEVDALRAEVPDPFAAKKRLASALVARYHGPDAGEAERAWWENAFSERSTPTDLPEVAVAAHATLLDLVAACATGRSRSEIRRLAKQGAIKIEDTVVAESALAEPPTASPGAVLKVGKRGWYKLT